MIKITIVKNESTVAERRLDVLISEKSYDALINALYPVKNRNAKEFVALVNFLYKDNNSNE